MTDDVYLAALLREQEMLMSFGDSRRLAAVDDEIRRVRAVVARTNAPVGRSSVPLETAAVQADSTASVAKSPRRRGGAS